MFIHLFVFRFRIPIVSTGFAEVPALCRFIMQTLVNERAIVLLCEFRPNVFVICLTYVQHMLFGERTHLMLGAQKSDILSDLFVAHEHSSSKEIGTIKKECWVFHCSY